MSSSRDEIFGRIRSAVGSLPEPAKHPEYDTALPVSRSGTAALDSTDRIATFAANWQAVSGRWAADWNELAALLQSERPELGYCGQRFVSRLQESWPKCPVSTEFDRQKVDQYAFGITPAWGAIAETGTIILTDQTSGPRLSALAPWMHVAVVPRDRVFATVVDALAQLPDDPSIILATGPSKTADIEGILIEGVHGPGIQVALVDDLDDSPAKS